MTQKTSDRTPLGPNDWLLAGFRALVQGGHGAIRAEALARELNATKGSFYWHFKDLRDFQMRMLSLWRDSATHAIADKVQFAILKPRDRVLFLMELVSQEPSPAVGGPGIEPAIRAWSMVEPWVADYQRAIDEERLMITAKLFKEVGLSKKAALRAAQSIYALLIGAEVLRMSQPFDVKKILRQHAISLMDKADR